MKLVTLLSAAIGAGGLIAAMLTIWYLDVYHQDFEEKLSIKIAAATGVFSLMMFTPLIDVQGGFLDLGMLAFPSLKVVADAITLGFLASALKDLLEREQKKREEE